MTRPRTFAEGAILRPGAVRSLAALLSRLSPAGRSALVFLTLLALLGLAAPLLPLADPASVNLAQKLAGPGPEHWLGTDSLGRDLMSRVIWGVRSSLLTALAATAATALFGALYGGIALYISTKVMDMVVYGGSAPKLAYIISNEQEKITHELLRLEAGSTAS